MTDGSSGWQRRAIDARGPDPVQPAGEAASEVPRERLSTFFRDGCRIDGRLVVRSSIELDVEFRGAIESRESVTVGADAAIQGDIRARSVWIHGAVVGDVEASREIVISATGRLHGSVSTPSLVVERGAFFNGETRMYRPEIAARLRDLGSVPDLPAPDVEPAPTVAPGAVD